MSDFRCGFVAAVTLILVASAPSWSQQSGQPTINNQGVRALIAKSPPGKSDADYAREMNMCESLSLRQMNDQANTYAACMLHFGNRPNLPDGAVGNSTPSPQNRNPQIMAGPNRWVPPGQPRPVAGAPPASSPRPGERWMCRPDGIELSVDRSTKVVEVVIPALSCDLVITNGVTRPLSGRCPFVSGNPLLPYEQFVRLKGGGVEFGYQASGAGSAHLALSDAAYAKYTLAGDGKFSAVSGGGDKASGTCVRE